MTYQVWFTKKGATLATLAGVFGTMAEALAYIDEKGWSIDYEGTSFSDPDVYFFDC